MATDGASVVPVHVAIIPDGNRRWARSHGLASVEGHRRAYTQAFDIAEYVASKGVQYMTFYAMSTENWKRAKEEVDFLLGLLERFVEGEFERLHQKQFRIRFFGSRVGVSRRLREAMAAVEDQTKDNDTVTLNLCFNYGGKRDLVEAVQSIVREKVPAESIDESVIEEHLSSRGTPPVDLVIRTSGEQRLSNFLLWEANYAELVFMDLYWPEFGSDEVDKALSEYARRQRRHGA